MDFHDWTHCHHTTAGSTLIAALESKRNCLAIENDGVQFIHSKTRCVTIFGRNEKQETQVEKEKEGEKEEEELEDPEVDSDDLYDRDHMPEDDAETH